MLDWNPNKRELRTTLAVVVLCVLVAQSPLAAESGRVLNLQDAKFWTFFNGAWTEGADGLLQVPKTVLHQDGPAMQGHHYAFFKPVAYRDLHAQFEIRLMAHSDAGLIFRAASAGQFYILHFPNCGQASRAQHFWAALSRMDEDGYLRIVKLGLVNRVPSNLGIWLGVDAVIRENRVLVRIGDEGVFEATDAKYAGPGRVGLYIFGEANIRNVRIDGAETPGIAWDENKQPRRTWFYPTGESANAEWQRPGRPDSERRPTAELHHFHKGQGDAIGTALDRQRSHVVSTSAHQRFYAGRMGGWWHYPCFSRPQASHVASGWERLRVGRDCG
jgi:hypothetical protein